MLATRKKSNPPLPPKTKKGKQKTMTNGNNKHLENISGDQLWQLMACLASPWDRRMKDECSTELFFSPWAKGA